MGTIKVTANRLRQRKKGARIVRIVFLVLLILFSFMYVILGIIFNGGRFTVTLDPSFALENGLVMYESISDKNKTNKLYADSIDHMDNISVNWINKNIDNESDGAHNGDNYIAYTFYLENEGNVEFDYWAEIVIDDVIKHVDEAVRIMVIHNGESVVYGKVNSLTGKSEDGCVDFYSDRIPVLRQRHGFKPGDIDKYTIVIWLEGDDPDCVDAIIGGEIKMHMDIREEHIVDEEK